MLFFQLNHFSETTETLMFFKKTSVQTQHGFTIIELMLVVAILSILASLGTIQASRLTAKTRQSEARIALGAIYGCEQAFFTEFTTYTAYFDLMGYIPEGNLYYNSGFIAEAPETSKQYKNEDMVKTANSVMNSKQGCKSNPGFYGCTLLSEGTKFDPESIATVSDFTAQSGSKIFKDGLEKDIWSINEKKELKHDSDGLIDK